MSSTRGFRVRAYKADDAMIVECEGQLTSDNAPLLQMEIKDLVPLHQRIVLDLRQVPLMDSAGLGLVVGLYVTARTRGCRLELVNANEAIRKLFSVTNVLSLFEPAGRHYGKTI
ncbi:MAG TPA: STAS domain-containing protein [Candidatus Acidoferrum sp.]